ncbi:GntR family transcriptional regulator [Micromonospora endophytica]|uniref:GntR family transcriptional regulator n=1 Tax=Micromonospora endophytica TaxID=515350 RepID=A0A2W2D393_9ACTN|nr:GntR family transcriptional regulator [Micromonospora endophytica]PZG00125.1 GntR family transcriptional regulator [Micromonospora endophytica]RIW42258.1 GntR family transcriptional regulator [Micromonospora endophytica]BCJ61466.1 GntR family transcriptional regulator [Micromonospora endophytica]
MATPEQMAETLRRAIREKVIPPGSLLVQEDLARRFKVSRNPVREALRILGSEGLVEMSTGGRASVRQLTLEDLQDIYDLRIVLEPSLTAMIVEEARGRDIAELSRLADEMVVAETAAAWLRLNYDFHLKLYDLAARPHARRVCVNLLALTQPYSQENIEVLGGRHAANREHQEMIDAIRTGDADVLAVLFRQHLTAARDRLTAARVRQRDPADIDLAPVLDHHTA